MSQSQSSVTGNETLVSQLLLTVNALVQLLNGMMEDYNFLPVGVEQKCPVTARTLQANREKVMTRILEQLTLRFPQDLQIQPVFIDNSQL